MTRAEATAEARRQIDAIVDGLMREQAALLFAPEAAALDMITTARILADIHAWCCLLRQRLHREAAALIDQEARG